MQARSPNQSSIQDKVQKLLSTLDHCKDSFLKKKYYEIRTMLEINLSDHELITYFIKLQKQRANALSLAFRSERKAFYDNVNEFLVNIRTNSADIIPIELWAYIFSFMSVGEQARSASVCRNFHTLFQDKLTVSVEGNSRFKQFVLGSMNQPELKNCKKIFPALKRYYALHDQDQIKARTAFYSELDHLFTNMGMFQTAHSIIRQLYVILIEAFFFRLDYHLTIDLCDYLLLEQNKDKLEFFREILREDFNYCSHVNYLCNLMSMSYYANNQLHQARQVLKPFFQDNKEGYTHALAVNYMYILEAQGEDKQALRFAKAYLVKENHRRCGDHLYYFHYKRTQDHKHIYLAPTLDENKDARARREQVMELQSERTTLSPK